MRAAIVCFPVIACLGAAPAVAQDSRGDTAVRGEVVGTVLDAGSGHVLSGAVVLLEPRPGGALRPAALRASFWSSGVTTTTDYVGGYRFTRIPPGEYRLVVRRLGYRPTVLELELRRAAPLRLSVGLVVAPILLEPEEVVVPAALFTSAVAHADDFGSARLDAELFRQRRFLPSDVQILTHRDVVDAVTLGETDLFRALHRLPGVTTRDDFTAELWTRGAPWSHTRVTFDGLPLFNPLHTGGVFSGVNPDAIGAAFFHPGVRSAEFGDGAAGSVELSSRAGGRGGIGGVAELSVVSGRLALDGGLGERGGWAVTGRRSYFDLLTSAFADSAGQVPYAFLDLTGRVDVPLSESVTLEVSGLWERDEVRGTVRDLLRRNQGHWGNGVARATVAAPLGTLYGRHTVGVTRYGGHLRVAGFDADRALLAAEPAITRDVAVTHQPMDNTITHVTVRSRIEPLDAGASRWAVGYEFNVQDQRYEGPTPRPYPVAIFTDSLRTADRRAWLALWAERRVEVGPLTLQAGLRTELSSGGANAGPVVVGPRLSARYAPTARAALTVGVGRTYQRTQAVAPAGPGVGPELHLTDVWLTANDTLPAVRADVATVGAETWLGAGWLGAVNGYGRYSTGLTVSDPHPGVTSPVRPVYSVGTNRALGVEFSLRRLTGSWTGSVSYSHGSSEIEVDSLRYPAPTERRHVLDITAMFRVSSALRVGAAVSAASGAPFTRHFLVAIPCDSTTTICPDSVLLNTVRTEMPGEGRSPTYIGVDFLADWTHAFRTFSLGAFLQLRNAIDRRGAVTYAGSYDACPTGEPDTRVPRPGVCDAFDRGLPLLPLLGVSVRF